MERGFNPEHASPHREKHESAREKLGAEEERLSRLKAYRATLAEAPAVEHNA